MTSKRKIISLNSRLKTPSNSLIIGLINTSLSMKSCLFRSKKPSIKENSKNQCLRNQTSNLKANYCNPILVVHQNILKILEKEISSHNLNKFN